ncbi:MAG TPA: YdcH family protein [Sphingomicrobium sp.]
MINDNPVGNLEALRSEHRELDERIRSLSSEPTGDQLELARLKRRKLMIKDRIQLILDSRTPDIIA